jgi:hypothetical protein
LLTDGATLIDGTLEGDASVSYSQSTADVADVADVIASCAITQI